MAAVSLWCGREGAGYDSDGRVAAFRTDNDVVFSPRSRLAAGRSRGDVFHVSCSLFCRLYCERRWLRLSGGSLFSRFYPAFIPIAKHHLFTIFIWSVDTPNHISHVHFTEYI